MSISCLPSVVSELAKVLNCFNAREIYLRWRTSFNCFNKRNCIYQCLSSSSRQRVVVEVWHLSQENGLHCSHASKCIGCCLHHVISASMGLAPSCVERGATLCWHSRKVSLDGGCSLLSLIRVTRIVTPADLVCGRRIKELYSYQVNSKYMLFEIKCVGRGATILCKFSKVWKGCTVNSWVV